jgi:hypothetical protein
VDAVAPTASIDALRTFNEEIPVNNSKHINDEPVQERRDEDRAPVTDAVAEIETEKLEQVAGGGDGTAIGIAK